MVGIVILIVIVASATWFFWHQLIVASEWLFHSWRGLPWLRVLFSVLAIWGLTLGVVRLALAIARRTSARMGWALTPKHAWWFLPTVVIALWGIITVVGMVIENEMSVDTTKEDVRLIYQLLTGNWSAGSYIHAPATPQAPLHKPFDLPVFRIGASVSFGIVLNLVSLGLLAWLVKRVRDLPRNNVTMLDKINWKVVIGSLKGNVIGKAYPAVDALEKSGELTSQNVKKLILTAVQEGSPTIRDLLSPEEAKLLDEIFQAPVAPSSAKTSKTEGPQPI